VAVDSQGESLYMVHATTLEDELPEFEKRPLAEKDPLVGSLLAGQAAIKGSQFGDQGIEPHTQEPPNIFGSTLQVVGGRV